MVFGCIFLGDFVVVFLFTSDTRLCMAIESLYGYGIEQLTLLQARTLSYYLLCITDAGQCSGNKTWTSTSSLLTNTN